MFQQTKTTKKILSLQSKCVSTSVGVCKYSFDIGGVVILIVGRHNSEPDHQGIKSLSFKVLNFAKVCMYVLFIDCRKTTKLHHTKSKSNKHNTKKYNNTRTEIEHRVIVTKEKYLPCHVSFCRLWMNDSIR